MQSKKGWEKSWCQFYDGLSIDYCGSYEGQLSHITSTLNLIQKIQKSKRMNWLSKEIKMYICKFFQRKNSSWFWLYFVVTITIIQKNHRPSAREHPSDLVLHLIGREIGMSFLDHSTGEYASDEFLYWLGEKMAWVFWSNHRALQIQSRMAFDNQW